VLSVQTWSPFRPAVFRCLLIGVINPFTSLDLIYVMTAGGPTYATEVLIPYIYRVAFVLSKFDYPPLSRSCSSSSC